MKESFKIEKELLFKHNIKDITSISLDRDYKIDNNVVNGNFLINGEYKVHELSLNKEKFNFKVPFKYELNNDIDSNSINVEIINFVYDYSKDELIVKIEYEISGDRKDVLEFDSEESLDDFLKNREVEIIDTRNEDITEPVSDKEIEIIPNTKEEVRNIEEIFDDIISNTKENNIIEDKTINIDPKEESIKSEDIVNSFSNYDNNITYIVYKLSEIDTIESIVMKFHTSIDELKEYNDLTNLSTNSKIIIPIYER